MVDRHTAADLANQPHNPSEHLEPLSSAEVMRELEIARHRRRGVCLYATQVMRGSTFAVGKYPRDFDEAECLMYPSDGGLKLSVAVMGDVR